MGAEINDGFGMASASVIGRNQTVTVDLQIPRGCLRAPDPLPSVDLSLEQILTTIDAVAHVRTLGVNSAESLISNDTCLWVRPYFAELLTVINITAPQGDAPIFWFGRSWDTPLTEGDELITFLSRDANGNYHELDAAYRLPVHVVKAFR